MISESPFDFLSIMENHHSKTVVNILLSSFPRGKIYGVVAARFLGVSFRAVLMSGAGCGEGRVGMLDGSRH